MVAHEVMTFIAFEGVLATQIKVRPESIKESVGGPRVI